MGFRNCIFGNEGLWGSRYTPYGVKGSRKETEYLTNVLLLPSQPSARYGFFYARMSMEREANPCSHAVICYPVLLEVNPLSPSMTQRTTVLLSLDGFVWISDIHDYLLIRNVRCDLPAAS